MTTIEIVSAVQLKVTEQQMLINELSIKAVDQQCIISDICVLSTEIKEQLNILNYTVLILAQKNV